MLKTPIAAAVLAALSFGFIASTQAATVFPDASIQSPSDQTSSSQGPDQSQDSSQATSSEDAKAKKLSTVVVSGSLINNAQIQTATPTYTITAADIKARGFNSVTEVLQSAVQATGSVQGPQQSGGFTQGAQTVSLYGLSPEFTLLLIDGKPITNFGQLYNGQSNFNNISNIPVSLIDHIDVMPGGGSSIYGSSAIAGVVNIVTKQHMDGGEVSVRTGNYDGGGGANQRITAGYGHDFGKLSVLAAMEFDNSSPLWGYQRSLTNGSSGNPNGLNGAEFVTGVLDYGTPANFNTLLQGNINPTSANCAAIGGLFRGSTYLANATPPSPPGQFCGSPNVDGYTTFINQSRSYDGMLKLKYDLSDNVRLYSDVLLDWQQQKFTSGSGFNFWNTADQGSFIVDSNTGHVVTPQHIFAPEEMPGGYTSQLERQDDLMYQVDFGANGQFGGSNWDWDIYYLRSGDKTTTSTPSRMAAPMDAYFVNNVLGGKSLGQDPTTGYNIYNVNYNALYQPISPAAFSSFTQNISGVSNTWLNNTRATISNNSLFTLPGGDAGFAGLIEGGNEAWYEPVNPLLSSGQVWQQTATSGGGTRDHQASAAELNLPVFKQLTFDLSGRYDHYKTDGGTNHRFTYKLGVEYRPFDNWLIRGNYATAFRAPDMAALFLGPSGFYETVQDPYQCALAHSNNCNAPAYSVNVTGKTLSNPQLQPTTAKSWTAGTVWAPIENLSLSVDYLHISIANEVVQQDIPTLLKIDSQCLLGSLSATSALCQQTLGQVQRDSSGALTGIQTYFVNLANEETNSITAQAKYTFPTTRIGQFNVQLDYNDMLKHAYQLVPGTTPINQLTNPLYSQEFKSIVSGAITWSFHDQWSSTVFWHRYGPSPNYTAYEEGYNIAGAGKVGAWNTFNYSLTYTPVPNLDLSLLADNVFNKMPPNDPTNTAYPYFNVGNYNIYGREIMLQATLRFGGKTN
ncbi:MAG: TonB-dependent receptor [Rhodanobacter sp.]